MGWKKLLSREGVDLTTISFVDELVYHHGATLLGIREEVLFTVCHNRQIAHYVNIDVQTLGRKLYQLYFSSIQDIEKYYLQGQKYLTEFQAEAEKHKMHADLLQALTAFVSQYKIINDIYSITSFFAIDAWQTDFESLLHALIEQRGLQAQKAEILEVVYTPWKDTAIRIAEKEINSGKTAQEVAEKFQFLRSWSVVWYRPLDANWAENLKTVGSVQHNSQVTYQQALDLLRPNADQLEWLNLAPYIIFFKDWRDDVRREHVFAWAWLFENMGRQFGATADDCGYLTYQELLQALSNNKWPQEIIEWRKGHPCVITATIPDLQILVKDHEVSQYIAIADQVASYSQLATIKGLVAQSGKATGKVVLVKTYHDIKHVEEGDVLVANTTHPTYLPGMKKAVAFVTNEGGIISHAAIVAREMQKPCIVGTKNATLVLQNGDLIEVDGNSGEVRILKRSI